MAPSGERQVGRVLFCPYRWILFAWRSFVARLRNPTSAYDFATLCSRLCRWTFLFTSSPVSMQGNTRARCILYYPNYPKGDFLQHDLDTPHTGAQDCQKSSFVNDFFLSLKHTTWFWFFSLFCHFAFVAFLRRGELKTQYLLKVCRGCSLFRSLGATMRRLALVARTCALCNHHVMTRSLFTREHAQDEE